MNVLVTGAGGYFGAAVLPALAALPGVTAIAATDLRAPAFGDPKLTFHARDLLGEGVADLVACADAVVHLAFVVERRPGEDPARLNVEANQRVLAAALSGPRTVLFASSVMAYGFRPDPDHLLVESDEPASAMGFYYSEQKIMAERAIAALAERSPARVVVARPCAVGGPRLDAKRAALYRGRLMLMPRVPHPLKVQLLHEDDLGTAFATLLTAPAGAYNVAPDDAMTTREIARTLGQWAFELPMGVCRWAMDRAWRAGHGLMDAAWVETLAHPAQIASNAKLRALGWAPRFTTRETVLATARARSA